MVPWVKQQLRRTQGLSLFLPRAHPIQRVREGSSLSTPTGTPRSNGQRVAAVERLKAAVAERKHVRDKNESNGTSRDIEAAVTVRAADEKVDAQKRWLSWVDRDKE